MFYIKQQHVFLCCILKWLSFSVMKYMIFYFAYKFFFKIRWIWIWILNYLVVCCLRVKQNLFFSFIFFFFWGSLIVLLWVAWSSLCRLDWAWTHREPSALISWMMGLKVGITMPDFNFLKKIQCFIIREFIHYIVYLDYTQPLLCNLPASLNNPLPA